MFFIFEKNLWDCFCSLFFLKFHVVSSVSKNNFDSISKKKNVFETTKRFLSFFLQKKSCLDVLLLVVSIFYKNKFFVLRFLVCMCFFCFARFDFVFRNSWKETMLLHFVFLRSVALFLLCSCFNAGEGSECREKRRGVQCTEGRTEEEGEGGGREVGGSNATQGGVLQCNKERGARSWLSLVLRLTVPASPCAPTGPDAFVSTLCLHPCDSSTRRLSCASV